MTKNPEPDWDPRSEPALSQQTVVYDAMRRRCPVAYSQYGYTSLFRHDDVVRVLNDPETFSSAVSRYPSVPNGMDPPQHGEFRRVIEPYFSPERMTDFEPACRDIVAGLVTDLPENGECEMMGAFAQLFAVRVQCRFLGWPASMHESLRQWTRKNHAATLARDAAALNAVALEFDGHIKDLLAVRRSAGASAPDDITTSLMRIQVYDRPIAENEIVSILRNWTVGELGTISASVGILAHYLAGNLALQRKLREQAHLLPAAIDEILRIRAPLTMNRRVTACPVTIRGRAIAEGERIAILWGSANRDEAVFGDPDEFRLDRDPALNLLYGAGIHVCPGAPLARLELRIVMEELLKHTSQIAPIADKGAVNAHFPAGGFSSLPLWVRKKTNPS